MDRGVLRAENFHERRHSWRVHRTTSISSYPFSTRALESILYVCLDDYGHRHPFPTFLVLCTPRRQHMRSCLHNQTLLRHLIERNRDIGTWKGPVCGKDALLCELQ